MIKKIVLKYYALNRTHVSRKFRTYNRHDKQTNNVALCFDFAYRMERGYARLFDEPKHV